jgi:oligoribonuclease
MPRLDNHLHYRNVDVSSIKELARRWFPRIYFNAPEKNGGHRALADILESIRELDYYRSAAFVAPPGPTTEDTQAVAAGVVEKWAPRMY